MAKQVFEIGCMYKDNTNNIMFMLVSKKGKRHSFMIMRNTENMLREHTTNFQVGKVVNLYKENNTYVDDIHGNNIRIDHNFCYAPDHTWFVLNPVISFPN